MTEKNENSISTVLVVDDNPQNLELLLAYLEDVDCKTVSAAEGAEAVDKAKQILPDLILLDVMMPKMSGFEVCKRLKNDPRTTDIPIIMVTALSELGDIERAIDLPQRDRIPGRTEKRRIDQITSWHYMILQSKFTVP